ncbi:hypothetical protein HYPSUDRAFT_217883 [Hypholoma sublateritium FD-334 SS-4]|uniref:Uncharacterized protein n=1 Tax=Hypholoma sublateritium (strain FD-334 SS-4) TaxID=945553 RepID=A0A0D2PG10_HYPSF|nr:hypothetical protein HYPSUDRAFT_217883 [Hypholoma sublateritium FD-334 SS-4]
MARFYSESRRSMRSPADMVYEGTFMTQTPVVVLSARRVARTRLTNVSAAHGHVRPGVPVSCSATTQPLAPSALTPGASTAFQIKDIAPAPPLPLRAAPRINTAQPSVALRSHTRAPALSALHSAPHTAAPPPWSNLKLPYAPVLPRLPRTALPSPRHLRLLRLLQTACVVSAPVPPPPIPACPARPPARARCVPNHEARPPAYPTHRSPLALAPPSSPQCMRRRRARPAVALPTPARGSTRQGAFYSQPRHAAQRRL